MRKINNWFLYGLASSILLNLVWFVKLGILSYADWGYRFNDAALQLLNYPSAWDGSSLGSINIQASNYPINLLEGLLSHLHLGFGLTERLLFMWPIVLASFIGSYLLVRHLTGSDKAAFFGSMVYQFNSCTFILHSQHLNILGATSFAPGFLLSILLAYEKREKKHIFLSALLGVIISIYDFRIFYILCLVIIVYLGFELFYERIKLRAWLVRCKPVFISLVLILLMNAYWILVIGSQDQLSNNAIFSRDLFGAEFLPLTNSIALTHSFWSIHGIQWFSINSPMFYMWILPTIVILSVITMRKKKYILCFSLIALLGIFLSKQSSAPFGSIYYWLYSSFPGFNAFREASKFYVITALAYAVLIGAFLGQKQTWEKSHLKTSALWLASSAVLITLAINVIPFYRASPHTLFTERHVPSAYLALEDYLAKDSSPQFRTLWLPSTSRWTYATNDKPASSIGELLPKNDSAKPFALVANDYFNSSVAPKYLSLLNYKYIIIPVRDTANEDDFYQYFGNDRSYFVKLLDSQSWLTKLNVGGKDLAVYRNEDYGNYVTTSNSLTRIGDINDIEKYDAFSDTATSNSNFEYTSETRGITNSIEDLFEHFTISPKGQLKSNLGNLPVEKKNSIYSESKVPQYVYSAQGGIARFTATTENNLVASHVPSSSTKSTVVSTALENSKRYRFSVGKKTFPLDTKSPERTIGSTTEAVKLFSEAGENLVNNRSFENSTWQKQVEDCNNYDDHANISMWKSESFATDGNYSLALGAGNHTACTTSPAIPVSRAGYYNISFDYRIKNGTRASYDLLFNDKSKTVSSEPLLANGSSTSNLSAYVQVPDGASSVKLRLKAYPNDNNNEYAVTYYDNVKVLPLGLAANISDEHKPTYSIADIKSTETFGLFANSAQITNQNLIKNPSLEDGLWQKEVGDCNNYDDKPILQMRLENHIKTNGARALELLTSRHTACTGPDQINVKEGKNYYLSFDYQSSDAPTAGYHISFNDPANTNFSQILDIKNSSWQQLRKQVAVPYGATRMSLTVYGYSDSHGGNQLINRYDNFKLIEIPNVINKYYLVSSAKTVLKQPEHISYRIESQSRKNITVAGATSPFYLNMSEAYNKEWKLELNDAKTKGLLGIVPGHSSISVQNQYHYNLDGLLNTWYVEPAKICKEKSTACVLNKDGSYNISLVAEFAPQRYFYAGLIVSGVTLAGCLGYLGKGYLPRRHKFKGWRYVGRG